MIRGNEFYGHRAILAEYAGLTRPTPIRGMVQHGWSLATGLPDRRRRVERLPAFVWSERNVRRCADADHRNVTKIGAPFLYLRELADVPPSPAAPSTILYPYHTSEWDPLEGSHNNVIEAVKEREEGPVTACLYWLEFENTEIRRTYEDAGFRVICHGRRDDPGFLRRQFDELARHSRVITNRTCTALFYGGAMGREIDVYGEVFAWVGGTQAAIDAQEQAFPDLVRGDLSNDDMLALSEQELGFDGLRSPDELRDLLGWTDDITASKTEQATATIEHFGRSAAARAVERFEGARSKR